MLAATSPELLSLKVTQSRGLLLQGYKTRVEVALQPRDNASQFPVAAIMEKLLAPDSWFSTLSKPRPQDGEGKIEERLLVNLRGRPAESFGVQTLSSSAPQSKTEELLMVEGEIFNPVKQDTGSPNSEETEIFHFNSSLVSRFKCYRDSKHIVHSSEHLLPSILQGVVRNYDFVALSRLIPAKIKKFRFGFEFYRPHWLGGMLGNSLEIRDRFYLEVESRRLWLSCEQASGATAGILPFEEEKLIQLVSQALEELEIISELYNRLLRKL